MRPARLEMWAFGPFAREASVDFTLFAHKSLFLITGETGAGKTTIFDAITFALFGQASGEMRTSASFQSDFAPPGAAPRVRFSFTDHEKTYTVERTAAHSRPARRGSGGIISQPESALLTLPDGRVITGRAQVNQAVESLLGMGFEQFSQIAMLAQGEFVKLLKCKSDERAEVFRRVFGTGALKRAQDLLSTRAKSLLDKMGALEERIVQTVSEVAPSNEDTLPEAEALRALAAQADVHRAQALIDALKALSTARLGQLEASDGQTRALSERLARLETLGRAAIERDALARQLKALENALGSLSAQGEKARAALKAARESDAERAALPERLGALRDAMGQYAQLESVSHKADKASERQKSLSLRRDSLAAQHAQLNARVESAAREVEALAGAGRLQAEALVSEQKAQALYEQAQKYRLLFTRAQESAARLAQAQAAFERSSRQYAGAAAQLSAMEVAYQACQAGLLAQNLRAGAPCPVCGSTEHPAIAPLARDAVDQNQLEKARARLNGELYAAMQRDSAQAHALSAEVQSVRAQMDELKRGPLSGAPDSQAEIERYVAAFHARARAASEAAQLQRERVEKRERYEQGLKKARAMLEEMQKQMTSCADELSAAGRELAALTAERNALSARLPYASLEIARAKEREMDARLLSLTQTLSSCEEAVRRHAQESEKTRALYEDVSARLKQKQAEYDRALLACGQDLSAGESAGQAAARLKEALESARLDSRAIFSRAEREREALSRLRQDYRSWQALFGDAARLDRLNSVCAGRLGGAARISFERYVQGYYFERVIEQANMRLAQMTSGRYELMLSEQGEDRRSSAGLDLNVMDNYTGRARSARSLSGGESFMAALSLALGLSDIVQQSSGGVEIDALFIDEGFGSLDEDSLELAISTLSRLAGGRCMTGIISHVEELKTRIGSKIVVRKGTSGSQIELVP